MTHPSSSYGKNQLQLHPTPTDSSDSSDSSDSFVRFIGSRGETGPITTQTHYFIRFIGFIETTPTTKPQTQSETDRCIRITEFREETAATTSQISDSRNEKAQTHFFGYCSETLSTEPSNQNYVRQKRAPTATYHQHPQCPKEFLSMEFLPMEFPPIEFPPMEFFPMEFLSKDHSPFGHLLTSPTDCDFFHQT